MLGFELKAVALMALATTARSSHSSISSSLVRSHQESFLMSFLARNFTDNTICKSIYRKKIIQGGKGVEEELDMDG